LNLAEVFTAIEGHDAPVEFVAYDGSKAGTVGSDIRIELRSPKQPLRHLDELIE
jgi:cyclopropane-fatty-acyl-phospholipid synthase